MTLTDSSSDTEKASSATPSPAMIVSVVEAASVKVVDALPRGIPRDTKSRTITLQRGDILSIIRAGFDGAEAIKTHVGNMPGNLSKRRTKAARSSLSEDSLVTPIEPNDGFDGSNSTSNTRPNRFARLRDNRFLRATQDQQGKGTRTPSKRPRLGANLSHNIGNRRPEWQTKSKLDTMEPGQGDQENQQILDGQSDLFNL